MKTFVVGMLFAFSGLLQAATNCELVLRDSERNILLNKHIHFELANVLSGSGGIELYTYLDNGDESIRMTYGLALADQTARFSLFKIHSIVGEGTVEETTLCEHDLAGGEGSVECFDNNLMAKLNCKQVDEGPSRDSQLEVLRRLTEIQNANNNLLKCGMNLNLSFEEITDDLREKLTGTLFDNLKSKNILVTNAQSARATDTQIKIKKKFIGCKVILEQSNPAVLGSNESHTSRAISCNRALERALNDIKNCNQ